MEAFRLEMLDLSYLTSGQIFLMYLGILYFVLHLFDGIETTNFVGAGFTDDRIMDDALKPVYVRSCLPSRYETDGRCGNNGWCACGEPF